MPASKTRTLATALTAAVALAAAPAILPITLPTASAATPDIQAVTPAAPTPAAPAQAATGSETSVPFTPGKGVGSGTWGVVGDIETAARTQDGGVDTTFNYGLAFDGSGNLWVTDSGKVG